MTPEDVPGSISLDQLVPWMRSLELHPAPPPARPDRKVAASDDGSARDDLRTAA